MSKRLLVKLTTLLVFGTLVACFLLYRTGKLAPLIAASSNQEEVSTTNNLPAAQTDTLTPSGKDSISRLRMSSSKSLVLTDDRNFVSPATHLDTAKLRRIRQAQIQKERNIILSSSKSGQVFSPFYSLDRKIDSLLLQNPQKQKN